ncbi:YaeQ family protein [Echinimonas agarilytica]|uniref:YaeQ family protein n=1 Tax=Echinimonas agarilytica TaxID=1215918 RepID=A0AA41WA51_9GAMM|nr:YaeQ family protein [Echinimonas agarilytica]MCM2681376.1 YaeQ family protein [Echinimonas agarilytica]
MTLKSTIYKASLQIADMDRHHYQDHSFTLAQHPSETLRRMMVRVLAYAIYAHDDLSFTKGLCADDEPELWHVQPDNTIDIWIELGTPDTKRIKKACSRARQAILLCYGDNAVSVWWKQNERLFSAFDNLTVIQISDEDCDALEQLVQRTMHLSVNRQDNQFMISNEDTTVDVTPSALQGKF